MRAIHLPINTDTQLAFHALLPELSLLQLADPGLALSLALAVLSLILILMLTLAVCISSLPELAPRHRSHPRPYSRTTYHVCRYLYPHPYPHPLPSPSVTRETNGPD